MPAKDDRIQKTFFVTEAQDKFLRLAVSGNLSDYIRNLIAADLPAFPMDMPGQGEKQVVVAGMNICPECSKEFPVEVFDIGGSQQVYCSEKCAKKAQNRRNYERRKVRQ
jgi:hypothetical protein